MIHGRFQLADWLTRSKLNQRAGARVLGIHYTFLNQILLHHRQPGLANAVHFERLTGIPVEAWMPTEVGTRKKRQPRRIRTRQYLQGVNA